MSTDTGKTDHFQVQPGSTIPHELSAQSTRSDLPSDENHSKSTKVRELRLYSHSSLFYWWPVWLVGYAMALLTYWHRAQVATGDSGEIREY